jgi:hypothetical protein
VLASDELRPGGGDASLLRRLSSAISGGLPKTQDDSIHTMTAFSAVRNELASLIIVRIDCSAAEEKALDLMHFIT